MAQIIQFSEIQAARQRGERQARDRESLEHAVALLKQSLATAAELLNGASGAEQSELLERVERLAAMVRYGLRMLGEIAEAPGDRAPAYPPTH
jgi:uncharacterized membrane protein YccC